MEHERYPLKVLSDMNVVPLDFESMMTLWARSKMECVPNVANVTSSRDLSNANFTL